MKSKNTLKSIVVLVAVCLVIALAMAAVNMITKDRIADAEREKEDNAMSVVLPENGGFEEVKLSSYPESVTKVCRDLDGDGYVIFLSVKGYDSSKPMSVAVGMTNEGRIAKCQVISCNGETAGIGTKVQSDERFLASFVGKDRTLEGVSAISGATISSGSLIRAVAQTFDALSLAKEVPHE